MDKYEQEQADKSIMDQINEARVVHIQDFQPQSQWQVSDVPWVVPMFHLSQTSLSMYLRCPEQFRNRYIQGEKRKPGEALVNLQANWQRVRAAVSTLQEKAKVPKKDRVNLSDVTIHDLRRSFASVAARMGYPELIVAALLGHSAGSVTAGYARLGADPLRDVVEAIGGRVAALLDGEVDLEAEAKATKAEIQTRRMVRGA